MHRELVLTDEADRQYEQLLNDPAREGIRKQVKKTLGFLEINLRHPSLRTHKYSSLTGVNGEDVFEAYAQQDTPGAYRVFFHYGPDRYEKGKRIRVLTIVAITPHP